MNRWVVSGIVAAAIAVLSTAGVALSIVRQHTRNSNRALLKQVNAIQAEQRQEFKRRLEDDQYRQNESAVPAMRRSIGEIERIGQRASGPEADMIAATVEFAKNLAELTAQLEAASADALACFDYSTMKTPEDLTKAIVATAKAEQAAQAMHQALLDSRDNLSEACLRHGVSKANTAILVESYFQKSLVARQCELYQLTVESWKEASELLALLDREWGKWKWDAEAEAINFDSPSATEEAGRAFARLESLEKSIDALQIAILKKAAGGSE